MKILGYVRVQILNQKKNNQPVFTNLAKLIKLGQYCHYVTATRTFDFSIEWMESNKNTLLLARTVAGARSIRATRFVQERLHRLEQHHAVLFHDDGVRAFRQLHQALARSIHQQRE